LKGRVAVINNNGMLMAIDSLTSKDVIAGDEMREVFRDGKILISEKFSDIKKRIASYV
jgi:hypothetical protein